MQYETAEGVVDVRRTDKDLFLHALEIFVERQMVETIPSLVDQVRVSEEKYVIEGDQNHGEIASVCTRAVKELLDLKYGPIQGIEYGPPIKNRRWQWQ